MTEPTDLDMAVSRLEGAVAGWPDDDGGSVLVEAHDLRTILTALQKRGEALKDIDAVSQHSFGFSDFAMRRRCGLIARAALSPSVGG